MIGDLDSLLVPDELPERRTPESVTDAEVAEVAVELAARMLHDVRDLRHERRDLRHELEAAAVAMPTTRASALGPASTRCWRVRSKTAAAARLVST